MRQRIGISQAVDRRIEGVAKDGFDIGQRGATTILIAISGGFYVELTARLPRYDGDGPTIVDDQETPLHELHHEGVIALGIATQEEIRASHQAVLDAKAATQARLKEKGLQQQIADAHRLLTEAGYKVEEPS